MAEGLPIERTAGGAIAAKDERPQRNPRRGMYVLPSLFTAGNIAAGYYAIMQGLQGSADQPEFFNRAALAIGFAVLFDGLDGRIARMTNTSSDFGKELDSLADVITFGVAPSVLAYIWGFRMLPLLSYPALRERVEHIGVFICFLFLICGASRLARFNISVNPQPRNPGRPGSKYFVGMPIPAGAGVIAAVIHFFDGHPIYDPRMSILWIGLIAGTGLLMVSNWRFWSGKEIRFGDRHPFQPLGPTRIHRGSAGDVLRVDANHPRAWLSCIGCPRPFYVLMDPQASENCLELRANSVLGHV